MFFIGVDVGTKSVRAAIVSDVGSIIDVAVRSINVHNFQPGFYEQNSLEIWEAVCSTVHQVSSNIAKKTDIKGIGFDATCSMVVLGQDFESISVSVNNALPIRDIIMWMDHRAQCETDIINSQGHDVLKYVGGTISIEMQVPKLMWLKKNHPQCWSSAKHFIDLPDFLTFKATGNLSRSLCSTSCKWSYISEVNSQGWDDSFLTSVGLDDLCLNNHEKIGSVILPPGTSLGRLTKNAADALGLSEDTMVGTSLIDAHAGALALAASKTACGEDRLTGRLGMISGTSTCHMLLSENAVKVNGVWGPYYGAISDQLWTNEGGQSATGSVVDHVINGHVASRECPSSVNAYAWLENHLEEMRRKKKLENVALLTENFHVYPDFHGNRSPLADSNYKAMVCGLTLDDSVDSLAILYLATMQALAYGAKDIIDHLAKSGHQISSVLMCGGLSNSKLFIQTNADAFGLNVLIPTEKESVLLGAAMLGACAFYGSAKTMKQVAFSMGSTCDTCTPDEKLNLYHECKYKVFKKMQKDQLEYRNIMGRFDITAHADPSG